MGYWILFWKRFGMSLKKATGEQVIGALLAIATVFFQIRFGLVTNAQVHGAYWSLAWPYLILAAALFLRHLVKTPVEMDTDRAKALKEGEKREEALKSKIEEMEQRYFSERPELGVSIQSVEGLKTWYQTNQPVYFYIHHLGGRVPTAVHFDPLVSKLGKYSLRFDALAHVDPPVQKLLRYEVQTVGHASLGYKDRDKMGDIDGKLLRYFVSDSPEGAGEIEYTLIARFKDRNEERSHSFKLRFDQHRFRFLPNTA
jgi:hypothetical protein